MARKKGRKGTPGRGRTPAGVPLAASRSARGKEIQKLKRRFQKNAADEEAFVKLWDVYLEAEAWEAMVDLLQKRLEVVDDPKERVRHLIKLGSLFDEKLLDVRRAVDTFHQVLTIEPQNRRAIWALGMLYHDLEDWEKVIEIYLLRISMAQSPEEKLTLRAQLAQIYEQRLQQEDQALMEYIRAARLAPQNVRVLLNMEKLATRTESFRELLAVYEDVVERIDRVELRIALYLKLARLYTEHLDDEERTAGYYRRAIELSEGKPERLFSISTIYGEEEEWEELIATYTQLIRHAEQPGLKSRIRREIARLYQNGLGDEASAFFELVRVARYSPSEPGLVDEIFALGTACEKHLELAAVLEDIGTRIEDKDQKAALYTRLARLHLDDLHNADMARDAIQRALESAPAFIPAQVTRFDLLDAGKEYEALAKAIESFLARPDLPEDVSREQRKRLARVYEQKLGDRERAVELFRANLQESPQQGAPPSGQREEILEELYRRQGTFDELIGLLSRRMDEASDDDTIANTALEIASIYEENLDRSDQAFFELVRAVRAVPRHERLLDTVFRLARDAGFVTELQAVVEDLAATLDDQATAAIQARLGWLCQAQQDPRAAEDHYRRALELDATQEQAYRSLRRFLKGREEWEGVVEIDLRRASFIHNQDEKLELLFGAAEILEDVLGSELRSADVYDRILGLDPGSTAARKALQRLRGEAAHVAVFEEGPTIPDRLRPADFSDEEQTVPEHEESAVARPAGEPAPPAADVPPPPVPAPEEPVFQPAPIDAGSPGPAPADDQADEEPAEVLSAPRPAAALDEEEEPAEVVSAPRPAAGAEEEEEEPAEVFSSPRRTELEPEPPGAEVGSPAEEQLPAQDREPTAVGPAPRRPEDGDAFARDREPTLVAQPPAASASPGPDTRDAQNQEAVVFDEKTPTEPRATGTPAPPEPPVAGEETAAAGPQEEEEEEEEDIDTSPMEEETTARHDVPSEIDKAWQSARTSPDEPEAWENLASLIQADSGAEAAFVALEEGVSLATQGACRDRLYRRMSMLASAAHLRMRLGRLLEDHERLDDAESSYRAVIREDSAHTEALDGLYRIYASRDALDRYDAILTRTLGSATGAGARRTLLLRRAGLRARELERLTDALADLEQLTSSDEAGAEALALKEEILEKTGAHEELAATYQRHLESSADPLERVKLLMAQAELYQGRLGDPDQAAECYRAAIQEAPRRLRAYHALASLLENKRDWLAAIDVLREATGQAEDPGVRGELHVRIGKLLEEQLLRPEEAEEAYRAAIDLGTSSLDALRALKGMARRRGDWVEVIRLGQQLIEAEPDPAARAEQHCELARVWRDKLDNPDKTLACYEEACRLDPDHIEAARAVADARLQDRHHEEAHELLERLSRLGEEKDMEPAELAAIHFKLAQTADFLDRPERAAAAYEQALELAPTDHRVLTQFGYHLARNGRWERAVDLYREILDKYRHKLEPNEVADVHCLAAQGWVKLGKPEDAVLHYGRALKANPRHLPALRASVDLARQLGRHQDVVDHLRQLYELTPSPATRFKLARQIGDVLDEQLGKPVDAAAAYNQALEEEPNNIELLEKLRRVLVRAEQYQEAVSALERLAHLSPGDRQRARFLRIAGDIQRERLDDDASALEYYLRALRFAPLDKRAHSAAERILNRMRDWPRLVALYEDLLQRLPPPIAGQEDRRIGILTELVELHRYRLNDRPRAIRACEQLLAIAPDHIKIKEDLARLYETEGRQDDAVAVHRALIADSPFSIDSYHALRRIYEHQGRRDRTLCMAATLAFLDEASPDEQSLLKENRHALPVPPGRRMSEALYNRQLLHPGAGGLLGEMLSFAADFCRQEFVIDHREHKLKPRERMNLTNANSKIASTFRQALEFLDLPPPEVYGRGAAIKGIMAVNTSPVAVLYAEDAVRKASISELRFMVGRAIAFTRPENLLAAALSPKQLRILLEAMVEIAYPASGVHPASEEVAALARRIEKKLPAGKANRLHQLVSAYRDKGEDLPIRDWLEGVEHTCNRAGFVLCGDLEAAVRVLKAARVVSPTGSSRSLIRELIFFSISENYFTLRASLKAAID